MTITAPETDIKSINFMIDKKLEDILRYAVCLYSKMDALIDSKRYNQDEYPGNALCDLYDQVCSMIYCLGEIIGHEIASQAFDMSDIEKGGVLEYRKERNGRVFILQTSGRQEKFQ